MKVTHLPHLEEIKQLTCPNKNADIQSLFCGDLHSWAVAHLQEGACWCTVMANVNTLAVASLQGAACVILCHGTAYNDELIDIATEKEINLFATNLPEFEAAMLVAKEMEP